MNSLHAVVEVSIKPIKKQKTEKQRKTKSIGSWLLHLKTQQKIFSAGSCYPRLWKNKENEEGHSTSEERVLFLKLNIIVAESSWKLKVQ